MPGVPLKPARPRLVRGAVAAQRLAGAWPLADRSNPTRDYAAGNGLTLNGGCVWSDGPDGPAITFDGAATSFLRSQVPVWNPATTNFTIACHFTCTTFPPIEATLFSQEDGTGTGRSWLTVQNNGALRVNIGGVQTSSAAGLVVLGTWHHVGLVVTVGAGAGWTVYLDGNPVLTASGTQNSNVGFLRVGYAKVATAGLGLIGQIGRSGVAAWLRTFGAADLAIRAADPYRDWRPTDLETLWLGLTGSVAFAASGGPSLGDLTASGLGSATVPSFAGAGAPTLGPLTAAGSGTRAVPVTTVTGSPTLGPLTVVGAGLGVGPGTTGVGSPTVGPLTATGGAAATVPSFAGTGAPTLGALTVTAAGAGLVPTVAGQGSPTLGPLWVVADASATTGRYIPTKIYVNITPILLARPVVRPS